MNSEDWKVKRVGTGIVPLTRIFAIEKPKIKWAVHSQIFFSKPFEMDFGSVLDNLKLARNRESRKWREMSLESCSYGHFPGVGGRG